MSKRNESSKLLLSLGRYEAWSVAMAVHIIRERQCMGTTCNVKEKLIKIDKFLKAIEVSLIHLLMEKSLFLFCFTHKWK